MTIAATTPSDVITLTKSLVEALVSYKEIATAAGYKSNYKRAVEKYLLQKPNPARLEEFITGLRKLAIRFSKAATKVSVLYWNHGGTDHSQVPEGSKTSHAKAELFLKEHIIARYAKPEVLVVAEMRSKAAREAIENHGFKMVDGRLVDVDEVAVFVRKDVPFEFVHDGLRWITIKVKGLLVTGVHLHRKATHYPALANYAHGEGKVQGKYVVIGDFNRHPTTLLDGLPATAMWNSPSQCDHVVFHRRLAHSVATGNAAELERNPHPWIYASFEE